MKESLNSTLPRGRGLRSAQNHAFNQTERDKRVPFPSNRRTAEHRLRPRREKAPAESHSAMRFGRLAKGRKGGVVSISLRGREDKVTAALPVQWVQNYEAMVVPTLLTRRPSVDPKKWLASLNATVTRQSPGGKKPVGPANASRHSGWPGCPTPAVAELGVILCLGRQCSIKYNFIQLHRSQSTYVRTGVLSGVLLSCLLSHRRARRVA
jgi:hypothetical protein